MLRGAVIYRWGDRLLDILRRVSPSIRGLIVSKYRQTRTSAVCSPYIASVHPSFSFLPYLLLLWDPLRASSPTSLTDTYAASSSPQLYLHVPIIWRSLHVLAYVVYVGFSFSLPSTVHRYAVLRLHSCRWPYRHGAWRACGKTRSWISRHGSR